MFAAWKCDFCEPINQKKHWNGDFHFLYPNLQMFGKRGQFVGYRRSANPNLTLQQRIMSAILLTPGPVCSYHSFTQSGPPSFRSISKQEYTNAVSRLELEGVGNQIDVQAGWMAKTVFLKKAPSVAGPIVLRLSSLCTLEEYTTRFVAKVPVKIAVNIRNQLIDKGLVTAEQMRWAWFTPLFQNKLSQSA